MVSHELVAREFVHLHVHSQYSFLTSAVKLDDLAKRAKAHGMRAVALTDHANKLRDRDDASIQTDIFSRG